MLIVPTLHEICLSHELWTDAYYWIWAAGAQELIAADIPIPCTFPNVDTARIEDKIRIDGASRQNTLL
jgi:hypothetical protein